MREGTCECQGRMVRDGCTGGVGLADANYHVENA